MTTSTHLSLANLALILLVLTAAAYGMRTRRIPDWLMGMDLVSALVTQGMAIGAGTGCLTRPDGAAAGIGLYFGLFMLGGMGAGDVELMGAVDTFMGPFGAFHVALVSFLVGGVLMLVVVLLHRETHRSTVGVSTLLLSIPFDSRAVHVEG